MKKIANSVIIRAVLNYLIGLVSALIGKLVFHLDIWSIVYGLLIALLIIVVKDILDKFITK